MRSRVTIRRRGDAKAHLNKVAQALRGPKTVKVGFPAGKTDSDILLRAVVNEFGSSDGRVPERPYFRNAINEGRDGYKMLATSEAARIVRGQTDARAALSRMGLLAQGDIQESIVKLDTPPNAPSTIRQKGSSNPLIDTGEMRSRVTFKVED